MVKKNSIVIAMACLLLVALSLSVAELPMQAGDPTPFPYSLFVPGLQKEYLLPSVTATPTTTWTDTATATSTTTSTPTATPTSTESPSEWQLYTNPMYSYSVEYPLDWAAEELFSYRPASPGLEQSSLLRGDVASGVRIDVWTNYTSLDLIDWLNEQDPIVIQPRSLIPPEANARIAGQAAIFVVYPESTVPERWITVLQRGQKVLRILYTTPPEGGNPEIYRRILASFEFEDTDTIPDELPLVPSSVEKRLSEQGLSVTECCGYSQEGNPCDCSECTWWAIYNRSDLNKFLGNAHCH